MVKLVLLIFATIMLCGCGSEESGGGNCDAAINNLISQQGQPEEINKYDSGDYHSWSYNYWRKGFIYTVTWGGPVNGCETSNYTFSPINKNIGVFNNLTPLN